MALQKEKPMELTRYLYTRLAQLGVQTIYGTVCETNSIVQTNPGQSYIRNVNEAHAAYAADAYARVKGLAALVNTHGPNQFTTNHVLLSAHSEKVPIVHIVGYASIGPNDLRKLRQVQTGSLDQVVAYSSAVVLGVCDCVANAPAWIDAALRDCVVSGRPVYIGVPMAYAKSLVDGGGLGLVMDKTVVRGLSRNDPTRQEHVAEVILRYLQQAKDAVIIVDGGVVRQEIQDVVSELVVRTGLPTLVTLEGRDAIDAALPNHAGLYAGLQSAPWITERVGTADLLVHIGPCKFHVNAQYLHYLRFPNKIEIHVDEHLVGRTMSYGLSARGLLTAVLARLHEITLSPGPIPHNFGIDDPLDKITLDSDSDNDSAFTKSGVYLRVLKWMRDGNFLINHFSIGNSQNWVHHAIWERKDVAFAACLGVAIASKEMGTAPRILVFLDAQYSKHASQELATILQLGLTPIVFITREAPGMECLEDEDEFVGKRPDDFDSIAELGLSGIYQVNCVQSRRQLSDFLDSVDTTCLQIVELVLDSPVS